MKREDVAFKKDECPVCFYQIDSATPISTDEIVKPNPGDFSVCLHCGATNVYDKDCNLTIPSEDELEQMQPKDRELVDRAKGVIAQKIAKGEWIGSKKVIIQRRDHF